MNYRIAFIAAAGLLLGAGSLSAEPQTAYSYSPSAHRSGSSMTVSGGGRYGRDYNSTFSKGRCVQAKNDDDSSAMRAYCPQNEWLPY